MNNTFLWFTFTDEWQIISIAICLIGLVRGGTKLATYINKIINKSKQNIQIGWKGNASWSSLIVNAKDIKWSILAHTYINRKDDRVIDEPMKLFISSNIIQDKSWIISICTESDDDYMIELYEGIFSYLKSIWYNNISKWTSRFDSTVSFKWVNIMSNTKRIFKTPLDWSIIYIKR